MYVPRYEHTHWAHLWLICCCHSVLLGTSSSGFIYMFLDMDLNTLALKVGKFLTLKYGHLLNRPCYVECIDVGHETC